MVHIEVGRLKKVYDVVKRVNKDSLMEYRTQKFVLEILNTAKSESVLFELIGRMAGEADKFVVGDTLEVEFILKSAVRMYDNDHRYYPMIRAISMNKCDNAQNNHV